MTTSSLVLYWVVVFLLGTILGGAVTRFIYGIVRKRTILRTRARERFIAHRKVLVFMNEHGRALNDAGLLDAIGELSTQMINYDPIEVLEAADALCGKVGEL